MEMILQCLICFKLVLVMITLYSDTVHKNIYFTYDIIIIIRYHTFITFVVIFFHHYFFIVGNLIFNIWWFKLSTKSFKFKMVIGYKKIWLPTSITLLTGIHSLMGSILIFTTLRNDYGIRITLSYIFNSLTYAICH